MHATSSCTVPFGQRSELEDTSEAHFQLSSIGISYQRIVEHANNPAGRSFAFHYTYYLCRPDWSQDAFIVL